MIVPSQSRLPPLLTFSFDQMTSGNPAKHNLQVQINKGITISSLKKAAPQTISTVIVPSDGSMSAQQIKNALTAALQI
jgi:hypothetical protein